MLYGIVNTFTGTWVETVATLHAACQGAAERNQHVPHRAAWARGAGEPAYRLVETEEGIELSFDPLWPPHGQSSGAITAPRDW